MFKRQVSNALKALRQLPSKKKGTYSVKMRQREYCHNCNQYVDFEFEDVEEKQVIYCPSCGHEHYRVIDGRIMLHAIFDEQPVAMWRDKEVPSNQIIPIKVEKKFEGTGITNRRWGVDPRQEPRG